MVETQLRRRGIRDERVLAAMLAIPREEFVPLESRVSRYQDDPVHIGYGQTISQPYMTALMAESLELQRNGDACSRWAPDAATPRRCWARWRRG